MYYVDKKVSSSTQPQELEITPTAVYVRKEIKQVTEELEDKEILSYEYLESKYDKDEYLLKLAESEKTIKELKRTNLTTLLALAELDRKIEGDSN